MSGQFQYEPTTVPGPGARPTDWEPLEGCSCEDGNCSLESNCECLALGGGAPNFERRRWIIAGDEKCHDGCACNGRASSSGGACENRCISLGVTVRLEVFDTGPSRGLGLRTLEGLAEGQFVAEYAGESIDHAEVERRADQNACSNYILTVNEHIAGGQVLEWFVDPRHRGNLARFANHSCEPNLKIHIVRIGRLSPVVALAAARSIEAGEELTYDYGPPIVGVGRRCECGSNTCRGWLAASSRPSQSVRPE